MGNYLAIGAVTAIIKFILERELYEEFGNSSLSISTKAPHAISHQRDDIGLNIFLYHVSLNSGYTNYDLPRRDARGRLISNPLVGLDLHYLLTPFSGNNDEVLIQQILASTIRILLENPILTKQIIDDALNSIRQLDETNKILNSDIAEQSEKIKIIFKPISLEEITKIWSSYVQTNYRLSVAYLATVVLINGKKEPIHQLPVQERKIFVQQFRSPLIEQIEPSIVQWDADEKNMKIQIKGKNLHSDNLKVVINGFEITSSLISSISNEKLKVNLPVDLQAGLKTLKIIHGIPDKNDNDNPVSDSQRLLAFESNNLIFVLAPKIFDFPLHINKGTALTLNFKPPITQHQKVEILIGEKTFSQKIADDQTFPIESLQISTSDFPIGKFLFRLRVDGAESFLLTDQNPSSVTFKKYIGPEIEVTSS